MRVLLLLFFFLFSAPILSNIIDEHILNLFVASEKEKIKSIKELGFLKERRAVFPLILLLKKEEVPQSIKCEAISSLGLIKDERAFFPLIEILDSKEECIKIRTVWALGNIGDKRAIPHIVKLINDNSCWVRANVIEALRKLGAKSYIDLVAKSIYDKCADVRMNVVKFFEAIRYDKILPKLLSLADDENRWVRILLAKALRSYSPSEKALNTLFYLIKDKEIWVRIYAYTSLSYYPLKKEYREYYLRIFHQGLLDKNKIIRKVSAVRLYELKDKTSLPFFKKAMEIYSDDAIVLKIGTRLISKFHTINIDNFVKKANKLKDPTLICDSIWLVRKNKPKNYALKYIKYYLSYPNEIVRLCSVVAISKYRTYTVYKLLKKRYNVEKNLIIKKQILRILKEDFRIYSLLDMF